MKYFVPAVILLIVIVGFASFNYYQTLAIAGDLQDSLFSIQQYLEQEEWDKAQREIKQLDNLWKKADRWWTPFMDHREIDILDQSIGRVSSLVEVRLKKEAQVEVKVAKRMIQRIMEREGVSLSNIF